MEETGQKHTSLKEIVEKLDANGPKIDVVDWTTFDQILHRTDFTKCKNTMETMKLFYERLYVCIVFPHQDELHLAHRENGRMIVEWDKERRRANDLEKQIQEIKNRVGEGL